MVIEGSMKSFVLFLLSAACLALAAPARALPQGTVFSVVIPNGPDPVNATPVGIMYFELDSDSRDGCGYYALWENTSGRTVQADCWVYESKSFGHANCLANSEATFDTLIQRDRQGPCNGFDTFAQPQDLSMLVGMEASSLSGVLGLLQYSGAWWIYPFEATPYP